MGSLLKSQIRGWERCFSQLSSTCRNSQLSAATSTFTFRGPGQSLSDGSGHDFHQVEKHTTAETTMTDSMTSRDNSIHPSCHILESARHHHRRCRTSSLSCLGLAGVSIKSPVHSRRHFLSTLSAEKETSQNQSSDIPEPHVDPHKLCEPDLQDLASDIKQELAGRNSELCDVAAYYFDGQGKAIRPLISVLMGRAINSHLHGTSFLLPAQKQLALVSEMIHTATLVHDDVIDISATRRGKPSVNALFGEKKAIIAGDYILAKAGAMVARLNNDEVTHILAQVLEDLVQGEFMQMGADEGKTDRFGHYIGKTFNKTASLMAYCCKGVAILGGADEPLAEIAFQYGKHVGIAFQLIDDYLDFVSSTATMGKPTAADLQLGLATAPVLFAAQAHPELNELIERRFSEDGDVQKALDFVHDSDGLEQTKFLAQKYCLEAIRYVGTLRDTSYQKGLICITDKVLNRSK